MLFKFILTIKPQYLIKCCCSNTYKYKLLSGGQLSGGLKVPHPVEYFYILQAIIKLIYKYLIK